MLICVLFLKKKKKKEGGEEKGGGGGGGGGHGSHTPGTNTLYEQNTELVTLNLVYMN